MDAIIAQLPREIRIKMFFNWAREFAINGPKHLSNLGLVELFKSITILDLSGYLYINIKDDGAPFSNLVHLPFSSSLAHLNLSNTTIGDSPQLVQILGHPIFQHLVTLNLTEARIKNIDPLLNAPHQFPNLHTLDLSHNRQLSIPTITTTTQFPNLKVLKIHSLQWGEGFFAPPPPPTASIAQSHILTDHTDGDNAVNNNNTQQPTPSLPPPFQLETLHIKLPSQEAALALKSLSHYPHLSQLKELELLPCYLITADMINQLFNPDESVLKNLTIFRCHHGGSLFLSVLGALGQSPLLSNLTELAVSAKWDLDGLNNPQQSCQQSLQQFIHSPFLWNPHLKRLRLADIPHQFFLFDDLVPALEAANVKLETLDLSDSSASLSVLETSPCLSDLKELTLGGLVDQNGDINEAASLERLAQSHILSLVKTFSSRVHRPPHSTIHHDQLLSILSSPTMTNLHEISISRRDLDDSFNSFNDVIATICTQRINPDDETSPLKFGHLRKLALRHLPITDNHFQLIVENLTQLTHLDLCGACLTDQSIANLLAAERAYPFYPSTSLPNLVHLDISESDITSKGVRQLFASQLMDQLEALISDDITGMDEADDVY